MSVVCQSFAGRARQVEARVHTQKHTQDEEANGDRFRRGQVQFLSLTHALPSHCCIFVVLQAAAAAFIHRLVPFYDTFTTFAITAAPIIYIIYY